jgi:hypothetical protein
MKNADVACFEKFEDLKEKLKNVGADLRYDNQTKCFEVNLFEKSGINHRIDIGSLSEVELVFTIFNHAEHYAMYQTDISGKPYVPIKKYYDDRDEKESK